MRTTLLTLVTLLTLTGCGGGGTAAKPSPAPPAVQLDDQARAACGKLHHATLARAGSNPVDKLNASLDEYNAETDAARSTNPGLAAIIRGLAPDGGNAAAVTVKLRAWCTANWAPTP